MLSRPSNLGGPVPKFNDYHIWKAFQCLDDTNPVGRKKLSQLLGIGEGSTRTILSMMQDQSMITIGKSGILLTDAGTEFKKSVHMDVADISISDLTIGDRDCAVRVPKMARNVKYGCEERDAAIKSGATGATTLIYTNGKLIFPGSDYPVDPEVESKIRSVFSLKNDDVVIIGTGPTRESAEIGAVIAGLTIMGGLQFNRELHLPSLRDPRPRRRSPGLRQEQGQPRDQDRERGGDRQRIQRSGPRRSNKCGHHYQENRNGRPLQGHQGYRNTDRTGQPHHRRHRRRGHTLHGGDQQPDTAKE